MYAHRGPADSPELLVVRMTSTIDTVVASLVGGEGLTVLKPIQEGMTTLAWRLDRGFSACPNPAVTADYA